MPSDVRILVSSTIPRQDGDGPVNADPRYADVLPATLAEWADHADGWWFHPEPPEPLAAVGERQSGRRVAVPIDEKAMDATWHVFAHPMLSFILQGLWDLSNAPDIRSEELGAFDDGYEGFNAAIAEAIVGEVPMDSTPTIVIHGLHLLTLAGRLRRVWPEARILVVLPTAWSEADAWSVLPDRIVRDLYEGLLGADVVSLPSDRDTYRFVRCCDELLGLAVSLADRTVTIGTQTVRVRSHPLPVETSDMIEWARSPHVLEVEQSLLATKREHSLLFVGMSDLAVNVLRSLTAFDVFLGQNAGYRELVTYTVMVEPARTEIPEVSEYLERLEALAAVVNHRHGTPDWMPIRLRLNAGAAEVMAHLKSFDILLVTALREGVNLAVQAGALVNERDGVVLLSQTTSSHERLAEGVHSIHPFGIQQMADTIAAAAEMPLADRATQAARLRTLVNGRSSRDWLEEQLEQLSAADQGI